MITDCCNAPRVAVSMEVTAVLIIPDQPAIPKQHKGVPAMKKLTIISVFFTFFLASSMAMGMDGLADRINEARSFPDKSAESPLEEAIAKYRADEKAKAQKQ